MQHAVLEIRYGVPCNLTLYPTSEGAVAHATALAQGTGAHTDEEIAEYLKRGFITEGDWEIHLLTAETPEVELFHICEKKDYHMAWGVFSRKKSDPPTKPFLLNVITYDYDGAIKEGKGLAAEYPEKHFSIQGAANAGQIPDSYLP